MVRIICGRLVTGCDWISAKPDKPWMIGSYTRFFTYGPVSPTPLIDT
jgi:hypothetical protein